MGGTTTLGVDIQLSSEVEATFSFPRILVPPTSHLSGKMLGAY